MKSVRLLAIAVLALAVSACDQLGGRNAVVVIDLDAVARALGRDDVIAQRINQANQQLTSQLGEVAESLQEQIRAEREKYEVIGDEAEAELQELTNVANQRLQQTQRLAQQRSAEFRQAVINDFRNEVSPYASEIASERGAAAVVTVATPMLWFDSEVDITDEVIAAMRKAGLERTTSAGGAGQGGGSGGASSSTGTGTGTGSGNGDGAGSGDAPASGESGESSESSESGS